MNASELIKRITFSKAYEFLEKDPEQNFPRLIEWLEKLEKKGFVARQLPVIRKYADDPASNWYQLAKNVWRDVDDEVRKTLFTNVVLNGGLLENQKLQESRRRGGCGIPWLILLEPSGQDGAALTFDEMDDLVEQGKDLGACFYGFTGNCLGQRWVDIIALCNKNADCTFVCFISGDGVDDALARELLRVRNLVPALTLNRPADPQAEAAMAALKRHGLFFGLHCRYTGESCGGFGSEAFFDGAVARGARFAVFSPDAEGQSAGASEKQRARLYQQICAFRKTKALLTLDLWKDHHILGPCAGAGRGYCCITARGDVEPCGFVHQSDANIRRQSLLECCRSPLFRRIQQQGASCGECPGRQTYMN